MVARSALPWSLLVALLLTGGCLGIQDGATPTPPVSNSTAGYSAIAAEEDRIRGLVDTNDRLMGLAFEVLDQTEYEIRRRNASGVEVEVSVAYSLSVDCDGDNEPESSADGGNTVATYWVTAEETRRVSVSQAFLDPSSHC